MLKFRNLVIIPTYHSNLDFTFEVRKAFYDHPPDVIAVEFPENLQRKISQGVDRLPKISIVVYYDEFLQEQLFIPIDPADSLIEAIRLGSEYGIPIEYIDLFVKNYQPNLTLQPDSYVLNQLSLSEFYALYRDTIVLNKLAEAAYRSRQLKEYLEALTKQQEENLLESEGEHPNSKAPTNQDFKQDAGELDALRNLYMASRLHELMQKYESILVVMGLAHWESIRILLENNQFDEDLTAFTPEIQAELFNVEQEDLPKIMIETPNLVYQGEVFRSRQKNILDGLHPTDDYQVRLKKFDIIDGIKKILNRSLDRYSKEYNERISPQKLKSIFQYMRNLPIVDGMLIPKLFEIVLAVKGITNDDFAWIVWEECKRFPYATTDPKLDSLEFTDKGIYLHGKHFLLRRHIPIKVARIKLPLKPKPTEKHKGEWREKWNKNQWNLVSYEPEDIFEENYFQHVRQRSLRILQEQFSRIHKFTSTLMDGIDFRETIRNWAINHTIYVREDRSIYGEVDAVVIIFDRDEYDDGERYPFRTVWYAEHKQESDLGLYSTFPGDILVGPGISRVELGGVVSFFPPRGIPDLWRDPAFRNKPYLKSKADRLLYAGLIYSQKNIVVYLADSPPKNTFINLASRLGIKIIHLSLDRFNPVSLRALRNLHMLAGKDIRKIAPRYIRKRRY